MYSITMRLTDIKSAVVGVFAVTCCTAFLTLVISYNNNNDDNNNNNDSRVTIHILTMTYCRA